MKTINEAIQSLPRRATLIDQKPLSGHDGDKHLSKVLVVWERPVFSFDDKPDKEWVVWVFNEQSGGLFSGHYFDSFQKATEAYNKRV